MRHKLYNGNVPFFYLFSPFHRPVAPLLHSFECTQYFMIPANFISTSSMRFMLTKAAKETFKTFDGIKFNESKQRVRNWTKFTFGHSFKVQKGNLCFTLPHQLRRHTRFYSFIKNSIKIIVSSFLFMRHVTQNMWQSIVNGGRKRSSEIIHEKYFRFSHATLLLSIFSLAFRCDAPKTLLWRKNWKLKLSYVNPDEFFESENVNEQKHWEMENALGRRGSWRCWCL